MKYFSTRGAGPVTLDDALRLGIASDGGLFLPQQLPRFEVGDFDGAQTIPEVARVVEDLQQRAEAVGSEVARFQSDTAGSDAES